GGAGRGGPAEGQGPPLASSVVCSRGSASFAAALLDAKLEDEGAARSADDDDVAVVQLRGATAMLPTHDGALHDRAARALTVDHDEARSVVLNLQVLAAHLVRLARFGKVHLVRSRTARPSTIHQCPGRRAWRPPRIPPEPKREPRGRGLGTA